MKLGNPFVQARHILYLANWYRAGVMDSRTCIDNIKVYLNSRSVSPMELGAISSVIDGYKKYKGTGSAVHYIVEKLELYLRSNNQDHRPAVNVKALQKEIDRRLSL